MLDTRVYTSVALVLLLLAACSPVAPASPQIVTVLVTPEPTMTAAPTEDRTKTPTPDGSLISLSGSQTANTETIELEAGDYGIAWSAVPLGGKCFHGATLRSTTNDTYQPIAGEIITDTAIRKTYAYGLEAGSYYFEVNSGCDIWGFTIGRQ
jgi:hypothetical protein